MLKLDPSILLKQHLRCASLVHRLKHETQPTAGYKSVRYNQDRLLFSHPHLRILKMPAKDIYHDTVKNALIKDGWTITNDPLSLKIGEKDIYIDLAAEKLLVAEKQGQKIAVEVKSFVGSSEIEDLKNALGQYILYDKILKRQLSERLLYLAIRSAIFNRLFTKEIGQILLEDNTLKIIVFDPEEEVIVKWIN